MSFFFGEGFFLGLSLGSVCLATCAPVYIPILVQNKKSSRSLINEILLISLGRFISYTFFGLLTGYLGQRLIERFNIDLIIISSYVLLSGYLLFSVFDARSKASKTCPAKGLSRFSGKPFIIGLLTGIWLCPSFLMALTRGVDAGGIYGGMLLFIGFFLGTTIYFLPFGPISFLTNYSIIRKIGKWGTVCVAAWFIGKAGMKVYSNYFQTVESVFGKDAFLINFTQDPVYILTSFSDKESTKLLIENIKINDLFILKGKNDLDKHLEKLKQHSRIILIYNDTLSEKTRNIISNKQLYVASLINKDIGKELVSNSLKFLKYYNFKADKSGFYYKVPIRNPK